MINNITETATTLWHFVHGLQVTNFENRPITDEEAGAIHEIITAAEEIVKTKSEIYELLNKV
jgi:hypothetical protein